MNLERTLYNKIRSGIITVGKKDLEALAALYLCRFKKTGYNLHWYKCRTKFEITKKSLDGLDDDYFYETFYIKKGSNFIKGVGKDNE
jgi:hypothetical protein